jgi:Taurine catabolism dioxygenase TauD, TfdA family
VFESVARRVELKIKTRPGDLHFVNNLAVLHRRDEFVDDEGTSWGKKKKRHLVRMRIRNQKMGWELPRELEGEWNKAFAEEGERVWHLEPMPEGFFPLRKYPL